jgi:SAM-dependent methyltransferase
MNLRFVLRDWLLSRLQYSELRGVPVDSPEMTLRRRELLERNVCAHFSFERWYRELAETVTTAPEGLRVELGSGGGFLDQFIGSLIKTDVVELPFIDKVCQAERLPFPDSSTGALVMVNVLHHVGDVDAFLREAVRILVPSGVIAMIEPYVSSFSRLIYRYVHHEPFDPDAVDWRLPPGGRLSGGNAALPWIVFVRDRARFERNHPALRIESLRPHSPFSHLLSGGVTTRPLVPLWAIRSLVWMEARVPWAMPWLGVFFTVILRRSEWTSHEFSLSPPENAQEVKDTSFYRIE